MHIFYGYFAHENNISIVQHSPPHHLTSPMNGCGCDCNARECLHFTHRVDIYLDNMLWVSTTRSISVWMRVWCVCVCVNAHNVGCSTDEKYNLVEKKHDGCTQCCHLLVSSLPEIYCDFIVDIHLFASLINTFMVSAMTHLGRYQFQLCMYCLVFV